MTWVVDSSLSPCTPDLPPHLEKLSALAEHPLPAARSLFDPNRPITIGRAPGRLDLMGGIADYSGSLVLQLPIQEATFATIQEAVDRSITIVSFNAENGNGRDAADMVFQMDLSDFEANGQPLAYEAAQTFFQRNSGTAWAAYVAGAFLVLMREEGVHFERGMGIAIHSAVPEGKGVSSSAALEVATMKAIAAALNLSIEPRRMGLLCQMVENLIVGAPCGVMDQMTACCGEMNQLLALRCQPAEILPPVQLPSELAVWGIDSGIRHAVSGADYGSVRVGTFIGYRMILALAGLAEEGCDLGEVQDSRWGGYLANVTPSEFEHSFRQLLPLTIKGSDFISRFGRTTDRVTQVESSRIYAVRQPTAHPIYEHFRVKLFAHLLNGNPIENATLLGECMYQSHASYSGCGLGSDGTDLLVELARAVGPEGGIFGAKITGGGSGGTVAILGKADADIAVEEIAATYAEKTGRRPYLFSGSSTGAAAYSGVPDSMM